MYTLGIHCLGPNTSAALISNGTLLTIVDEERFTRIKSAPDTIPTNAIKYCLESNNITLADVSCIALGWDLPFFSDQYMSFAKENLPNMSRRDEIITQQIVLHCDEDSVKERLLFSLRAAGIKDQLPTIRYVPHHLAHAASVFFTSGLSESAILIADGSGENVTTSIWHGKDGSIAKIKDWHIPHSLGWYYAAITEFLGFKAYTGEGKVMGLAPYGNPNKELRDKLERILCKTDDGYLVDATYIYFDKHSHRARFTDKLTTMLGEPYTSNLGEYSQYYKDLAYETQALLEDVMLHLANMALQATGSTNLCVAGGLAMNCKMNGVLLEKLDIEGFHVFPGANDSGSALGAALHVANEELENPSFSKYRHSYYGPEFSNETIEATLDRLKIPYSRHDNIEHVAAGLLHDKKLIGWFQHKMEYGSRALGARSIIAAPTSADVKDKINALIKFREPFRPFAPSILREHAGKYLLNYQDSPFMMIAFYAKENLKELAPSIVHVDGSVRPQAVVREHNPRYHALISEYYKLSGVPLVLNTSFNIRGEPIVCNPVDAIKCFFGCGLDALVLGNYLVTKNQGA